jgi:predicted transcriptional regulator of viral defense system
MRRQERTPPDVALAELAGRQWGVVSLAQLQTFGIGARAAQRRAQAGRLRRLYRGVYAVGGATIPREGRWLAAVMAYGDGAVLSHVSAAAHWNLLQYDAPRPEVTAPASRHGVPGIRLHRSRSLDARDTTTHQGIPTTTVHRTLLDIAADVPEHHLERALAQAERLQLYDHRAIEDVIQRSNGHRGTKRLASAINGDPAWTRGELEARMRKFVRKYRLPRALYNDVVDAPDHPRLEVDVYFPGHGLVVETDGWEDHKTRHALESDRAKDAALTAAGYTVMRFTWRQLRDDPQTVADRITAGCCRAFASAPARAWSAASRAR